MNRILASFFLCWQHVTICCSKMSVPGIILTSKRKSQGATTTPFVPAFLLWNGIGLVSSLPFSKQHPHHRRGRINGTFYTINNFIAYTAILCIFISHMPFLKISCNTYAEAITSITTQPCGGFAALVLLLPARAGARRAGMAWPWFHLAVLFVQGGRQTKARSFPARLPQTSRRACWVLVLSRTHMYIGAAMAYSMACMLCWTWWRQ